MNLNLYNRLVEARKYFDKAEYLVIVERAEYLFQTHQNKLCEEELDKLPNSAKLLEQLVEKLGPQKGRPKGKSVYKTLKLIQEGKMDDNLVTAKGISSLLTHVFIEIEQGNSEYKLLVPKIIEKLNEVIYNTLQ